MKTFGGIVLNFLVFFGIWLGSSFAVQALGYIAWEGTVIAEYLRLGTSWFICPAVAAYYAPHITSHYISDLNVDSVAVSFVTIISCLFLLLMGFSIFAYGSQFGGAVLEMIQLSIQFAAIVIGSLMGKAALKTALAS